jgi:hypothetical protein
LTQEEKIKLARYYYAYGRSWISDAEYDALTKGTEWEGKIYEDEEIPYELLTKYSLESVHDDIIEVSENKEKYKAEILRYPSKSIQSIESASEAFSWFFKLKGTRVVFSAKVDGISTYNAYEGGELRLATTRGKSGKRLDITDAHSRIMPHIKDTSLLVFRGEAQGNVRRVRMTDGSTYSSGRSAAFSLARTNRQDVNYPNTYKCHIFKVHGFASLLEGLRFASSCGFEVVPYREEIVPEDLTFESFEVWLNNIVEWVWDTCAVEEIETDGVVVEVDSTVGFEDSGSNPIFDFGNKALKMYRYSRKYYKGKVLKILIGENYTKDTKGFLAEIKPVKIYNGNTITQVNVFNADIIIRNRIFPGSVIGFEVKSGGAAILVEGDVMNELEERIAESDFWRLIESFKQIKDYNEFFRNVGIVRNSLIQHKNAGYLEGHKAEKLLAELNSISAAYMYTKASGDAYSVIADFEANLQRGGFTSMTDVCRNYNVQEIIRGRMLAQRFLDGFDGEQLSYRAIQDGHVDYGNMRAQGLSPDAAFRSACHSLELLLETGMIDNASFSGYKEVLRERCFNV